MMIGTRSPRIPASERMDGEFYAEMRSLLTDHLTYCRMCLVTLVANSRLTNRNVAHTCRVPGDPPIDVLRDRFKDTRQSWCRPGRRCERTSICSRASGQGGDHPGADTYQLYIDRAGLRHFADYHRAVPQVSSRASTFRADAPGRRAQGQLQVVTLPGPAVAARQRLRMHGAGDAWAAADASRRGRRGPPGVLPRGAPGCEPVVLIGQDLGYTGHVYYTPGVAYQTCAARTQRFCTMEMKEWERSVPPPHDAQEGEGNNPRARNLYG